MDIEKLITVYKDYLSKINTTYALLLNGEWGSGKTYFWKNKLSEISHDKKFNSIYISLNGVNDINNIDELILSEIISNKTNSSNSIAKNGFFLLRNSINVAGKIFAGGSQVLDLFKNTDINFIPEETILCFDDLERTTIGNEVILGYINEFVEHKNLKVIIIADDTKIKLEGYAKLKEKVIGRELLYKPNIKEVYNSFLPTYKESVSKDIIDLLEKQQEFIQELFTEYEITNLRTLRFTLDILSEIYSCIINISGFEKILEEITLFTTIISNEYKSGELTIDNITNKQGIDSSLYFIDWKGFGKYNKPSTQKVTKTYGEKFKNKYFKNRKASTYQFFDSIYEYILSGYLNCNKLKTEINKLIDVYETPQGYALDSVSHGMYKELSNEEFKLRRDEVFKFAEQGKYELLKYFSIYNFGKLCIENNAIDMNEETLIDKLKVGINFSIENFDFNYREIERYKTFDSQINEIGQIIIDKAEELRMENQKIKAQSFLKILPQSNDIDEFLKKYFNEYNSIFRFLDKDEFYNVFDSLSNKRLMEFKFALNKVYLNSRIDYKDKELQFFQSLKEILISKVESNELGFPRSLIFEEFIEFFDSEEFKNKMN